MLLLIFLSREGTAARVLSSKCQVRNPEHKQHSDSTSQYWHHFWTIEVWQEIKTTKSEIAKNMTSYYHGFYDILLSRVRLKYKNQSTQGIGLSDMNWYGSLHCSIFHCSPCRLKGNSESGNCFFGEQINSSKKSMLLSFRIANLCLLYTLLVIFGRYFLYSLWEKCIFFHSWCN